MRRATRVRGGIAGPPRSRRGLWCRTPAFVQGVLARGAVGAAIARPVEMTLRAIGRASLTHVTQVQSRLDLRVAFTTRLMPAVRSRARVEPMLPWTNPATAGESDAAATAAPPAIAERIVERVRRIEAPAPPLIATPPAAAGLPAKAASLLLAGASSTPRELIVRRSVVVLPAARAASPEHPTLSLPRAEPRFPETEHRKPDSSRLTIPLSPSDLGRLTDDVVRILNSRVVAHRERQGVI